MKTLLLASLFLSTSAFAQEAPKPDAAADSGADAIVVTATRAPTSIDRVAASVTVLDKAAIDRNQDLTVADLLLRTPGVSLSRNGGYGTNTSLRIRGAETDQTVVVIDGVDVIVDLLGVLVVAQNLPLDALGGVGSARLQPCFWNGEGGDRLRLEFLQLVQNLLHLGSGLRRFLRQRGGG